MDNSKEFNRRLDAIGWGLLLILWGITILFDFVPFGVGLVGTGLIFLGANAVRALNGLPAKDDNTVLGILALSWGALELARPILLHLSASVDWDWAIFAILLVELGTILLGRELLRIHKQRIENSQQHA